MRRSAGAGVRLAVFVVAVAGASAVSGCAHEGVASVQTTTVHVPSVEDEQAHVAELGRLEERVLDAIGATDPRFAKRAGGVKEEATHAAAVKALAQGDADAAIEDGALDFFSFTARERSIAEAEKLADAAPTLEHDANAKLERELLVRLVAEERARLDEERGLPRGASALIRAVVETWTAPDTKEAVALRDRRIARRLDEVRASLGGAEASRLPRVALAELDDALDPLERVATPDAYPETAKAMARLRVALGDTAPHEGTDDAGWARITGRLHAHLGVDATAEALRAKLEAAERTLRAAAAAGTTGTGADPRGSERDLAKHADALTLASAACGPPTVSSRLRALPPPPERAPLCGALHAVGRAMHDHGEREAVLVALHDDVVVALWALAIHAAHVPPMHATDAAHPMFGAEPDREARLLRFAAVRPVAVIGAGLAAAELAQRLPAIDAGDETALAPWLGFGDAPLDIALRETTR